MARSFTLSWLILTKIEKTELITCGVNNLIMLLVSCQSLRSRNGECSAVVSGSAWIRIKVKSWIQIPDPHQFADDKSKCMDYEPI
jgi:hypothetical protein